MHIIATLLIGLVVGALARFIMPGDQKLGWFMTSILGVAGSIVASLIGQAAGWYAEGQPAGWIASVIGAIVLLFIVGKIRGAAAKN